MTLTRLFIHQAVANEPLTAAFRSRLALPVKIVSDAGEVYRWVNASHDPIAKAKKGLFLTRNKGAFVKDCPGTRHYNCCGYKILHMATYCTMDCAYCILQSYFHPPVLQYFVNQDSLFQEVRALGQKKEVIRIGTGEFTDSLIWDMWTDLSTRLIAEFGKQRRAVLELKTKTTGIAKLKGLPHKGKTIAAWSLNTPRIVRSEERGTATIEARLRAAAKCIQWGYPVAFHFDPLVIYDGWEKEYRGVLKHLFATIPPQHIVWISLGSFRFIPSLKPIIQRRFPRSKITLGEFITGLDNKMRYFKPLRIELYRKMSQWICELAPEASVYLCMEDDEVWQKALGEVPESKGGLSRMLDRLAVKHCGLEGQGR